MTINDVKRQSRYAKQWQAGMAGSREQGKMGEGCVQ